MADADAAEDKNKFCDICNFTTDRESLFKRHLDSQKHNVLSFLQVKQESRRQMTTNCVGEDKLDDPDCFDVLSTDDPPPSNYVPCQDNEENASSTTKSAPAPDSEWYPFASKIEMLCHVLMSSATHPVVRIK